MSYLWQLLWHCSFLCRCCLCWECSTHISLGHQAGAFGSSAGPCPLNPALLLPPHLSHVPGTGHKGNLCPWWTPPPSAFHRHHPCTETTQSLAYVGLHILTHCRAGRGGSQRHGRGVQWGESRHGTKHAGALEKKNTARRHKTQQMWWVWKTGNSKRVSSLWHVWYMDSLIDIPSWWLANRETIL